MKKNFQLADYLRPNGTKPYKALPDDLEYARNQGFTVYLWSVANQFMLAGHPGNNPTPWSDGNKWYKTATLCLNKR